MIYFILIFTILFCVFVEYYIGHISIRLNSSNTYSFNINSIINYLLHPLHNRFLWHPSIIHVNYPFMLFIGIIIYKVLQ